MPLPQQPHHWYTPAEIADLLGGTPSGDAFRAACPAHKSDNPQSLKIIQGEARDGTPMTLLHCFANQCSVDSICEALGIPLAGLWCVRPDAPRRSRDNTRSVAKRVSRARELGEPPPLMSQDDIAQVMLEEMIVSDPDFLPECAGSRETLWRLWRDPERKRGLLQAINAAEYNSKELLDSLAREWGGCHDRATL